MLSRRALLAALSVSAAAVPVLPLPAFAEDGKDASPADLAVSGSPLKDMTLGKADAPVKVYEYASMTCPHCARFNKDVFPQIKEKYIDSGKVLWTLREFPLDPRATAGFMLARCAGDDKYYPLVDVLFAQQDAWAFVSDPSQVLPGLMQLTKQAGFTQQTFEACLKDQTLYEGIAAVKKRAEEVFKIDGTPTFFINGKRFSGEITLDDFAKAVDPLLKA